MNDLVDTTEMYLRTIYDLEEEGIVPLRARIAERLQQSGPTVSQTIARMERDGLVIVADDRHLRLTDKGRDWATSVMRKHRLAERLLVDVIGLDWEQAHGEACRWEHVMSEAVERKLVALLDHPTTSPYGNPIPGLEKLGEFTPTPPPSTELIWLDEFAIHGGGKAEVCRIAEHMQADESLMRALKLAGITPDSMVEVTPPTAGHTVELTGPASTIQVPLSALHAVLARPV